MGNALGGKKTTKVMKISGETLKLKTPVRAGEVVAEYPDHVLLESEAVKHFGIRAKPLEAHQELQAKRLYFLVQLPKPGAEKNPRRVRSGIHVSARDRLESLVLARRSASDLSIIKRSGIIAEESEAGSDQGGDQGGVRLKLKVPRAEVEKLMKECKDEAEAAERIMALCLPGSRGADEEGTREKGKPVAGSGQRRHWDDGEESRRSVGEAGKAREKRVSFLPRNGASQLAVASY